jgi:putative hydrolases of HD superfamily
MIHSEPDEITLRKDSTMSNRSKILEMSDEKIMTIARQLRVAYALKRTLRYATQRDHTVHSESVAEHVFALFFLALYFLPLEDPERKLDIEKLYHTILFHDFGEIVHGDVPYHMKTKEHVEREKEAAREVFASLPFSMQNLALESWQDYEQQTSPEARFVTALDKVEPLFELLDRVNETSPRRLNQTYAMHITKKRSATKNFPFMRKFVDVISADMRRRNLFCEEQKK